MKLKEKDVLEIIDMTLDDLKKFTKEDLARFIWFQADVIHEQEKEIGKLKYGVE